ncbi:MAG: SCO family protein [Verrucomicrobiae bacterium]|nr:SCO family protein [Verrucomicrobiae bacterium]
MFNRGGVGSGVGLGQPSAGPVAGSSGTLSTTGKALIGGPFTLTDHTGKRVTNKDFLGRNILVFFGFTYCPDICPSGLAVLTAALDQLGAVADPVTPVFVTIDPERDTPEKMADYIKSFHPRFVGLTGSKDEIAAAVKAYRVYAKKVPDERDPKAYTMDHSSIAYLMGPDGQFRAFFPDLTKPDPLAAEIRKALASR